jgi:hypothetical protein
VLGTSIPSRWANEIASVLFCVHPIREALA